jgi:hypothetical protein
LRLEDAERVWAERLASAAAAANSRLEQVQQRSGVEAARAAEEVSLKAAEAEQRLVWD